MKRLGALVIIAFSQNFSLLFIGEGLYFYTHRHFAFTEMENLAVALTRGVVFVIAALASHALSVRLGERRQLLLVIVGQMACCGAIFALPRNAPLLVSAMIVYTVLCGLKWPVIESFFSAGKTPRENVKAVGWFNLSWASGAPLGIMFAGPVIASSEPQMLFVIAMGFDALSLIVLRLVEARPKHLPFDHPEQPDAVQRDRYSKLLVSSRWSMMLSYTLFFMFSPLLPGIFDRLGVPVALATIYAAWLHFARLAVFLLMGRFAAWHGRTFVQVIAIIGVPLGFAMMIAQTSLAAVLIGEVIYGAAAGLCYYAALYYAMVIHSSSVDAGGKHEATIGSGSAIGPLMGLASVKLTAALQSLALGMAAGMGPIIAVTTALAVRPLTKLPRQRDD
jgi:MFS family permease